jgi:hypothetical protein
MPPAKKSAPATKKAAAARTARNPATGDSIQVAASKKIAFRLAKELKSRKPCRSIQVSSGDETPTGAGLPYLRVMRSANGSELKTKIGALISKGLSGAEIRCGTRPQNREVQPVTGFPAGTVTGD